MEMILSVMNVLTKCSKAYTETFMGVETEFLSQRNVLCIKKNPNTEVQFFVVS